MKKSQWGYKKSYRIGKRKRFWRNKFFWLFFVFIAVFVGIFYFLIFSSFFQVQAIEISGLQKISKEDFENIIEQNIQKKILIFSSKNIFLADFGKMSKEALSNFPQLDTIKIKRKFPSAIIINVEEKKPVAIIVLSGKKFLLDKKGIIFEEIIEILDELPKIATDGLDENLNLGREIIDKNRLSKIIYTSGKLKSDLELEVDIFEIAALDRLIVKTKEGWEFYLNIEGDLNWQLTKLNVVLEEKIPPEKRRDLEYIELRFGNFAPYKFK